MKFVKSAALAVLIATAIGALSASVSSATEENGTILCKKHEDPCKVKNLVTSMHLVNTPGTSLTLLEGPDPETTEIKCSGVLSEVEVLEPEESPTLFTKSLTFSGCGNNHWICELIVLEQFNLDLLTTALNLGTATSENGVTLLVCEKRAGVLPFGFWFDMDCTYLYEGTEFSVTGALHEGESSGDGMITATEVPLTSGGTWGPCPDASLDLLLEPLDPVYLVTEVAPAESTALCKAHTGSTCKAEDQTKGLHLVTTQPPLLSSSGADVECQGSLAQADVQSLATEPKSQEVNVSKFTWEDCETHDTCSITNKTLPAIGIDKTALNLGIATAKVEVQLNCDILDGLIKLECLYAGTVEMQVEGASHKESSGNGMFTASGVTFKLVTGGSYCASTAKWDALYEPLEDVFIVS